MIILGIESSCDESSVCLIEDKNILAHLTYSQIEEHRAWGGVVPEIAARAHLDKLPLLLQKVLDAYQKKIDAIAATAGPGLIGGVMVGFNMAKAMSVAMGVPFYGINHLEGHILIARLFASIPVPFLALLVSGGHSQFVVVRGIGTYEVIGQTLDDSCGECFDKTAKMLGLFPSGKSIEERAKLGDSAAYKLPMPRPHDKDCHFSFSGIKNAARLLIEEHQITEDPQKINDFCASFQDTMAKILVSRASYALNNASGCHDFVICGGVAANTYIQERFEHFSKEHHVNLHVAPCAFCTDNGAMIAYACYERILHHIPPSPLDMLPRPRWPLDTEK